MGVTSDRVGTEPTIIRTRRSDILWNRVASTVAILAIAFIVQGIARNRAFDWPTFGKYFFSPIVLRGLYTTLRLTFAVAIVGIAIALPIAIMRLSKNRLLSRLAWLYVYVFRGVPLLVQLVLWFNFGLLYSKISLGVPFGPEFASATTNQLVAPFTAATLGFALHYAANISEVFRASALAVPPGQTMAAEALGMSRWRRYRRIVLPQAARVATPPLVSYLIDLVKATALVAFVGLGDLLYAVQTIYNVNFKVIALLMVATAWYLVIVTILSIAQHLLEKRLGRSAAPPRVARTADPFITPDLRPTDG
jgi:polar amino acid transport system permease protein